MKLVWIAAALALTGCGKKKPSSAEVFGGIAKTRDAHKDQLLARCKPAYTSLGKAGPVAATAATGVPALHNSNAAVLLDSWASWLEFHTDSSKPKRDTPPVLDSASSPSSPQFSDICAWVIAGKEETPDHAQIGSIDNEQVPALVEKAIADAEAVHYVVAIRCPIYAKPVLGSGGFTPGKVICDAKIFDDKGAEHGEFPFAAESSDKVETRVTKNKKSGEVTNDDSYNSIEADLKTNAKAAFTKALADAVPGSDLTIAF